MPSLSLTPELASPALPWNPIVEDDDRKSYAFLLRNADNPHFSAENLDRWFQALHPSAYLQENKEVCWTESHYKGEKLLRQTAWVVLDDGCQCDYFYSDTWQPQASSLQLKRVVREITQAVVQVVGQEQGVVLNCCNLNYYPQGGGVGFHADDEFLFDGARQPMRIISLSLCRRDTGGNRVFQVKRQDGIAEEDAQETMNDAGECIKQTCMSGIHEIELQHGDVMTMEGYFQRHYFHSVWPGDSQKYIHHPMTQGERINLTWRTIVRHLDGSDECRGKTCPVSATIQIMPE